jgi:hypothetical protein
VLILGGYGVFGGRLAVLLSDLSELELLICGRSPATAAGFCRAYPGPAKVTPVALDRNEIAKHLGDLRPDIVVDASGPFQTYGRDRYSVVRACIAARVHYIDFSDAADFVFGIAQFDHAARAAGVYVISGASSFPVLTAAVLREMARSMDIVSVKGGIAPSPFAGIGLNVMRAVLGYAGSPVTLRRDGQPARGIGIAETVRYTIAPPGRLPLRNVLFSLVEVPDLQVIPPEHPKLRDIWMGAGPVPEVLHRILILFARARAGLRLPPLTPLAPLFYRVLNLMKFGEHRGGMFVHATGARDGVPEERSWHLLAEGDDGPFIPSMTIEAVLRRHLAGTLPEPGARAGTRLLELEDYDRLFSGRRIHTGFRSAADRYDPLYRRILGEAFDTLPSPLRALHLLEAEERWTGRADVVRGKNPLARLIAWTIGFPAAGAAVPVSVTLSPENGGERWTRTFGTRRFESVQTAGKGGNSHLLLERFGAISVALALVSDAGRLYLVPRRWFLWGVPMPKSLLPSGDSFESAKDGRFHFDVTIAVPLAGLVVAYRGWLESAATQETSRAVPC